MRAELVDLGFEELRTPDAVDEAVKSTKGTLLVVALLSALLFAERSLDPLGDAFAPRASTLPGSDDEQQFAKRGYLQTEIWPFFLFALTGMLVFPAANDLLMMFVALEVMSLPLYLLAGMARRRRLLSQEAAMKYFLLGAFSSAFFLYGAAMLYGYSGTVSLPGIAEALTAKPGQTTLVGIGIAMLLVGLLFKVAAVPFHQWTPDVYEGSPTPVVAFLSVGSKAAGFALALRILVGCFEPFEAQWKLLFTVLAMAPGDPFAELAANPAIPPEVAASLRAKFGLDDPVWMRYGHWLNAMLHGDWGFSFASRINVETLILQRLPTTLIVIGAAQILAILVALPVGVLAGFPVVDVKVTLFDGSFHEVDSNENAFKMAASIGFKDGCRKASPVILEPMMAVEVETPEDYAGNVMGDLSSRRGMVQGMDDMPGGGKAIKAEVPLSEMFGYSTTLRSMSQGRATYTMEFKHYAEAPKNVADAIVAARAK